MFSKPLVAAGLVASVNASIVTSGIITQATSGNLYAHTSCMDCLSQTTGRWTYLKSTEATWMWKLFTEASTGVKVLTTKASNVTEQGFCCVDATTDNSSTDTANKVCSLGYSAGTTLVNTYESVHNPTTGNFNVLSQAAICPAYASVCGTAEKKTGTTAAVGTNKRTATLAAAGDAVTLKMTTPINTTGKNWAKESCSFVVMSKCGAPVVTFDSTSDAVANDWKLYFMEYTGLGATGATFIGDGTDNFFLKFDTAVHSSPQPATALVSPNDELDNVSLVAANTATLVQTHYKRPIPGRALYDWMQSIADGYTTYTTTVATYDAARKEWDDGKRGAKPYQPTQPGAVPTILNQLKYSVQSQVPKAGIVASGFGNISQYKIEWASSVNVNAGHYFGTTAGRSTLETAPSGGISTAATQLSNYHWQTNAGRTATGTGTTLCDKAYVQVTGHLNNIAATATKKMWVVVTEGKWAKTLEESIPSRPVATTAPKATATGAAYLSMGATAALVALSLS